MKQLQKLKVLKNAKKSRLAVFSISSARLARVSARFFYGSQLNVFNCEPQRFLACSAHHTVTTERDFRFQEETKIR